ncbi:MAG: DUF4252 domain-containing protein, partial [Ignavibacterium sp.]
MKSKISFVILLALSSLLVLPACIDINKEFSEVTNRIISNMGDDYKTQFQFSVGSAAITVSSWFVDFAAREEHVDDMMREISSVQVVVYKRVKGSNRKADNSTLESIDEEMDSRGWNYLVRTIEGDELTAIYVSKDPKVMLKKMYVVNLHDNELIIVEVNGDLKKVISYAVEERHFKVKT